MVGKPKSFTVTVGHCEAGCHRCVLRSLRRGDCGEGRGQRGNPIEEQGGALAEACGQPGGLVGGCAEERTSVFARYLIPAFIEP